MSQAGTHHTTGGETMLGIFRAVVERLKALLVVRAAAELEADSLVHAAERQAELLTRAREYEAAGHPEVAAGLRQRALGLDPDRPVAGVLPGVADLTGGDRPASPLALPAGLRPGNRS